MKLSSFLLIFLLFAIFSFTHIKIIARADNTLILTPTRSFYIPAHKPIAVYSFETHPQQLQEIIKDLASKPDSTIGIYIKNLSTGQEITLNENEQFTAASLYKLAIMYAIYELADQGKIDINNPTIQKNLKSMITISSNEAAYYFIDNVVSWEEVTKIIQEEGLKNTTLSQDPPLTTPKDMGKLLELLATGKAVNKQASIQMLDLLLAQQINDRIPVLLPPGTEIAHKTGELGDVRHDAGIVLGPENDFILVLMSKGSKHPESIKPVMSAISFEVFDFFQRQWANPPEIL